MSAKDFASFNEIYVVLVIDMEDTSLDKPG